MNDAKNEKNTAGFTNFYSTFLFDKLINNFKQTDRQSLV